MTRRYSSFITLIVFASFAFWQPALAEYVAGNDSLLGNTTQSAPALEGSPGQDSQGIADEGLPDGLPVEINNRLCPADFNKIDPENKFQYTHEGKTYNFDSQACIENFKKDPGAYIEAWQKKERFRKINIIND